MYVLLVLLLRQVKGELTVHVLLLFLFLLVLKESVSFYLIVARQDNFLNMHGILLKLLDNKRIKHSF